MRTLLTLTTLAALALLAPAAAAETFTVETTGDTSGNPADCTMPAGTCTLRAALVAAGPGDTIVLGAGTYENTGNDFTVGIGKHVRIVGAGARATTVNEVSGGDGRVFLVEQDARLELTSLTVSGSRDNAGVLMFGGGNALIATRVAFSGNTGASDGGAVDATDGAVTLVESTVSGNTATASGGGLYVDGAGTLALTNTTVTGNSAPGGSGIAVAGGQATLTRTTLAGNSGAPDLFAGPAPAVARLEGTIVGGCSGSAPASLGFNLDAGGTCGLGGQGDRTGDPLLAPPAANGGETDTMALGPGSAAIDAGGPCPPPATDQRGVARPQGTACDAGAFEAERAAPRPGGPRLTALRVRRVSRRAFRVTYRLDRAARVRFRLQRARPGRRAGGRCVPVRAGRPRGRPCTRWTKVRTFSRRGRAGRNAFRMHSPGLRLGAHRLVAGPEGGRAARRSFRVRRFRP